ncbi:MAG: hypothetical protein WD638_06645 [Nitriliruptoraceae bacterium]
MTTDPVDLQAAAADLLAEARGLTSGRSARTLTPGAGAVMKQSLLALTAGERLQDHVAPGPTTLFGITGTMVLHSRGDGVAITDGVWVPCPSGEHGLEAVSDAVVLITVAPAATPDPAA